MNRESHREELLGRAATRVGDTLRRPANSWSKSVHDLLRFLRSAGIVVPDDLGVDEQGREILSWVDGRSGQDESGRLRREVQTDDVLIESARLQRTIHDATTGFDSRALGWDPLLRDPGNSSEIVCHNDFSFWNVVFQSDHPVGVIDSEFAAPGSRLWDVAYAAWWLVPLHRPEAANALGWLNLDQSRRLRLFCEAYGLGEERRNLLDTLLERQRANQRQLRLWVREGIIPAFDWDDPTIECGNTDFVESRRSEFEHALS